MITDKTLITLRTFTRMTWRFFLVIDFLSVSSPLTGTMCDICGCSFFVLFICAICVICGYIFLHAPRVLRPSVLNLENSML